MYFVFPNHSITAREAPRVEIFPSEPQTVRVDESVQLSCRANQGIPSPTLVWLRSDGTPLQRAEEKYPGTILISNITFADAGEYECRATNIAGVASQTATINVIQPPEIRILPENNGLLTLTEGDELKLECFADGVPKPNVEWKEPSDLRTESLPGAAFVPYGIAAPKPQSLIQKYNIDRSAEGTYTCHASNEAGEDQKYITVVVQQKRGDVGKLQKSIFVQASELILKINLHSFNLMLLH